MASQILATASHVADKAKELTGVKNAKVAQLAADTKDVHDPSYRITTDFGVKQNNTDDWLSVVSDDKQGPQLLEDHAGREKVNRTSLIMARAKS
jgi:catalase